MYEFETTIVIPNNFQRLFVFDHASRSSHATWNSDPIPPIVRRLPPVPLVGHSHHSAGLV